VKLLKNRNFAATVLLNFILGSVLFGTTVLILGYRPPERYDGHPWTQVRVEESADQTGSYTPLETIAITPVDTDPTQPAARSFTTELGTAIDYWYRVVFLDATGDVSQPTTPVQNSAGSTVTADVYGTVDELALILKRLNPNPDQRAAMERVLSASGDVNSEIDRSEASPWQLMLATEVTLARGRARAAGRGAVRDLGERARPVVVGRDTWDRHALKLAP
jgi:hypothetical protein